MIVHFNEEGRAVLVAKALAQRGFAVGWYATMPNTVTTSATRDEFRALQKNLRGTVEEWWRFDRVEATDRRDA